MNAPGDTGYTVVVVAYHRAESLRRLLECLGPTAGVEQSAQSAMPEIVVVNVGNDPEVATAARVCSQVRIVPTENRGYAAAVNLGADMATHDVVVFTNDDIEPVEGAFETLVRTIHDDHMDIAVPRIVDGDGADEGTIRALPTPSRLFVEWAVTSDRPRAPTRGVQKWHRPADTERIDAATAAVVAVRTAVLLRHPLPEDYFLYWEELDWFWQLKAAGIRVALVPYAVVVHAGGREDVRADKQRLIARNAVRCVRRTQGRWAAMRAWPVVIGWQLRLLVVDTARALAGRGPKRRVGVRAAGVAAAATAWRELV